MARRIRLCIALSLGAALAAAVPAWSREPACRNWQNLPDAIGRYYPNRGTFYLQDPDRSEVVQEIAFGGVRPRAVALAGDWDGGGFDRPGLYDPATSAFELQTGPAGAPGVMRLPVATAGPQAQPVAGAWTGAGRASVGLYDPNRAIFRLYAAPVPGAREIVLPFGVPGETRIAIAGDWAGDGVGRVGLYDPASGSFDLRLSNDPADMRSRRFRFGGGGPVRPVFGRWQSASAAPGIAIAMGNAVLQRDALAGGPADRTLHLAPQGGQPATPPQMIAGRWQPSHCRTGDQGTGPPTPDWARDLVLYELRLATFVPPGTDAILPAAMERLPALQRLGVTGIILTPVHEAPARADLRESNFYMPLRPDRLSPRLGTDSQFRAFVDRAHALGLRVFVDVVLHGLAPNSPYVRPGPEALPADWFSRRADGAPVLTHWGSAQFDWTAPGLRAWWAETVGVGWVRRFGIDGFRMDLEPTIAGSPLWTLVRERVRQATGRTILLIPEITRPGRGYVYDMSQNDVMEGDFLSGRRSLVETVRASPERFYTSGLSNHDSKAYGARGRLAAFAYGLLLSPYVPRWFAGEEYDATPDFVGPDKVLYFSQLRPPVGDQPSGLAARVAQLTRIRHSCRSILAPLDRPLREVPILALKPHAGTDLEPYALWRGTTAIAVIAKAAAPSGPVTVAVPVDRMGMAQPFFRVSDMLGGTATVRSRAEVLRGLPVTLGPGEAVALKLEGIPRPDAPASVPPDRCAEAP